MATHASRPRSWAGATIIVCIWLIAAGLAGAWLLRR
jgi:hypothetical protein